ncbi:MAG: hypothetical protein HZA51_16075 [Planctomycetes bacterium]|nr:hypothetical protein [Planctomycetota bacterium]
MSPRIRFLLLVLLAPLACAGPGPRMFPVTPTESRSTPDGAERLYDTNRDGKPDYAQRLNTDGRVTVLHFDTNADGTFDQEINRLTADPDDRHLLIILDSVPYEVMENLWQAGRFRLFHPPSCTISPFPVMTDLSLAEFFGVSPCPGAESEYADATGLREGYDNYANERNCVWLARTDYHMINFAHAIAYLRPDPWFDHELHFIQKYFLACKQNPFIGYAVGTSALGANFGRNGHLASLIRVDRMCEQLMWESRGKLQITLLSDHGHALVPSKRVPLSETLSRAGYRLVSKLKKPGDVIVPEFGVVTYAGVYTREAQTVAHDCIGIDGIEQTMYLDAQGRVVVLARNGARATIAHANNKYRYTCESGDPLRLSPIITKLADPDGWIDDAALFEATKTHDYPDAVQRLWRAFHGLMVNPPDVMLAVSDGWHCGSKLQTALVDIQAAHGNLGRPGSSGFVMSTTGQVPGITRMKDLAPALQRLGVPMDQLEPRSPSSRAD